MKTAIVAALLSLAPVPVLAQAVSPATSGTMTIVSQSGPNYVLAAADANLFQIKAAQLAVTRAQRDDVKAYARRVMAETQSSHKALLAALKNDQRTIKAPSSNLSAGTVRISVCGRAVEHYAAMALMKRSPKMTANWAFAMDHSRGGIFHSFSDRFKIR
jgi:hypothetical protein